jgi:hypothetical protein
MTLTVDERVNFDGDDTTGVLSHDSSPSFTPADGAFMVAICGIVNGANGADVRSGMTMSGGGLTWERQVGPLGGTVSNYFSALEIWTAPVVTGISTTLTYAHAGNVGDDKSAALIHILEVTSDTDTVGLGTPNIASGSHDQGDAAVNITLGSAPASSSQVIAARYYSSNGGDGSATPEAAWTEIYDAQAGSGYGSLQCQRRTGSTSTDVDWDDVMDTGTTAWNSCAAAIEIKEIAAGPVIVQTDQTADTDAGSSITHNLGTSATEDNLMILAVCHSDDSGSPDVPSITTPSTWTRFGTDQTNAISTHASFWKIAGASEATTVVISGDHSGIYGGSVYWEISGHDSGQAPEINEDSADSLAADAPSLSPTGGAKDYLWLWAVTGARGINDTGDSYDNEPTGYSTIVQVSNARSLSGMANRYNNATSENPASIDITISAGTDVGWSARTIAVHPETEGSPNFPYSSVKQQRRDMKILLIR